MRQVFLWIVVEVVDVVQGEGPRGVDLDGHILLGCNILQILQKCLLNLQLLIRDLLLVHNHVMLFRVQQLPQVLLWLLKGNQELALNSLKIGTQRLNTLKLKPRPHDSRLSCSIFGLRLFLVVVSRIEAVNWDDLLVCALVLHGPVHDVVIMQSEIVAQPQNYSDLAVIGFQM